MTLKPLGEQLVVQILPQKEEENVGGVIVRNTESRTGFREGTIQAVGPRYKGDLRPGGAVLIPPYAGREVILNKERLVIISEGELPAEVLK